VHDSLPVGKPMLLAILAPAVIVLVFLLIRRLRRAKRAS
jgi:hypothetical protein